MIFSEVTLRKNLERISNVLVKTKCILGKRMFFYDIFTVSSLYPYLPYSVQLTCNWEVGEAGIVSGEMQNGIIGFI